MSVEVVDASFSFPLFNHFYESLVCSFVYFFFSLLWILFMCVCVILMGRKLIDDHLKCEKSSACTVSVTNIRLCRARYITLFTYEFTYFYRIWKCVFCVWSRETVMHENAPLNNKKQFVFFSLSWFSSFSRSFVYLFVYSISLQSGLFVFIIVIIITIIFLIRFWYSYWTNGTRNRLSLSFNKM